MRWAEHVAHLGVKINAYVLVGKAEGKMPRSRPRHRWDVNIKMDLKRSTM
jgi:hypothetical protein